MSQFKEYILPNPTTDNETKTYKVLDEVLKSVKIILNRGINFSDNVDCVLVTFTSGGADVENTIAHALGKVPAGYLIYSQNKAGSLYLSSTAWTKTAIYLKSSVATVIYKIIIF